MSEGYANALEHLKDELLRLDLMIQLLVGEKQRQYNENALPGLVISDMEIDALLSPGDAENPPHSSNRHELERKLATQVEVIRERIKATEEEGLLLPFPNLARLFGLTAFEVDVLLICLAPELDQKYQKLYGYLQDDITRKYPTLALVCSLLFLNFAETVQARDFFSSGAPLFKYDILIQPEEEHNVPAYLITRPLVPDARITGYLTGASVPDPLLANRALLIHPAPGSGDFTLSPETEVCLESQIRNYLEGRTEQKLLFYFHGPDDEEKKQTVINVCRTLNLPLLCADMQAGRQPGGDLKRFINAVFREGLLSFTIVYLENMDCLWEKEEETAANLKLLQDALKELGWIAFFSGKQPWAHTPFGDDEFFFEFAFPVPDPARRIACWQASVGKGFVLEEGTDLEAVACRFRFTRRQIKEALLVARNNFRLHNGKTSGIPGKELYAACRSRSNQKLLSFGRKIIPRFTWDDIVLPRDLFCQLQELCLQVIWHNKVYGEWGFESKHTLGRGINILFSGTSGTGKTMAAEVMANTLCLDLYKIDLSNVVSKYIGETEKNLSRIFYEARTSNAILFFDEADALFGKRSEVKDSHDRYANIEINFLLQKMEEQEGIVILATNMSRNIDNAFLRRLHFFINFPSPEKEERLLIWKKIFPAATPLDENVNFSFLARNFSITGGVIKNIALRAAFMAAGDGGVVNMKHIIIASKREFQKIGKLCLEADFKEYFDLVK